MSVSGTAAERVGPDTMPRTPRRPRRRWTRRAVLFLSAYAGVLGLGHAYIAKRLVLDPGLPQEWTTALVAFLATFCVLLVLRPVLVRMYDFEDSRVLAYPTLVWLGLWWVSLPVLFLADVGTLLYTGASAALGFSWPDGNLAGPRAVIVAAITLGAASAGFVRVLRGPDVRRIEVPLRRWPEELDGYRIVQISDVHIGDLLRHRFARRVTRQVNALDPDLVAVTGDLVDGPVDRLRSHVAPFADLRGRDGVFFVTGNHDFYSGVVAWVEQAGRLGFQVLRNERRTIRRGEASFDIAGVDDHHGRHVDQESGEDLDRALSGRNPSRPVVLLAHQPATFMEAARRDVDLQLSGHTHGGQIWPFHLVVRMTTPYLAGLYERNGSKLYVSRGTGFWGPPIRLFAPPEVTEIVIRQRTVGSGAPRSSRGAAAGRSASTGSGRIRPPERSADPRRERGPS